MITVRDRVRFVETDMMGVAHHANYLRWFEMGRVAYLRACGITLGEMMEAGVVFPITEVNAQFKNSLTFDDEFEVQVRMSAFNKAKMEFTYRVLRLRDGAIAVEGHTRNVFTDKAGHIVRLEPRWFEKIQEIYAKDKVEE
jgi:acyl-CoA thioester hydrolase